MNNEVEGRVETSRFLIITGMSGAGKSEAARYFEDAGYFCVDNLPPALIPKFAALCSHAEGKIQRVALVCDVRGGRFFDSLLDSLGELEKTEFEYQILYLEASEEALVRRFKETRRRHPLVSDGGAIVKAIVEERGRLEEIRGRAHQIVDTSEMTPRQLHEALEGLFRGDAERRLSVSVVSFGFKHGLPLDADMVFDVRFLPNPHYVDSLQPLSGLNEAVHEYVFKWPLTRRFMEKAQDILQFLMPNYVKEGKTHFVIAIGCTGGQHRSVAIAERLAAYLRREGYRALAEHRDVDKRIAGSEESQAT